MLVVQRRGLEVNVGTPLPSSGMAKPQSSCITTLPVKAAHHTGLLKPNHTAPYTHPLEPFFIPKLQNRFADFPNLHYSISPEAVNLRDLMRLLVRLGSRVFISPDFSRTIPTTRTHRKVMCSADISSLSPHNAIPGQICR